MPFFPRARYVIQRREWDYWSQPEIAKTTECMHDCVLPLADTGQLDLIEDVTAVTPRKFKVIDNDLPKIAEAYRRIEDAIGRDESAVDEDFSFHCSIAEATGNAQFKRFLDYLGRFIIPRQSIRKTLTPVGDQRAYLKRIQNEHMEILDAIRAGASAAARAAMRRHLVDSRKRYQKLVAEIGDGPAATAASS